MKLRIIIRGSNDIGSAVAHTLFTAGYAVVIHDKPQPTVTRRKMAFTDAVFDGYAILDDIEAQLVKRCFLLRGYLAQRKNILVSIEKIENVLKCVRPQVLVDARMRKHLIPEKQRHFAPLTIGLGPNFRAGITTDLAVETSWGEELGQVISKGATRALQGEPKPIGGHARDRYVYAPCSGTFQTRFQPGDTVKRDQEIAQINQNSIHAPLSGLLRGIIHDGVPVSKKTKIIEVDPRGDAAQVSNIAERPARIAKGVLEAIQKWEKEHHAS